VSLFLCPLELGRGARGVALDREEIQDIRIEDCEYLDASLSSQRRCVMISNAARRQRNIQRQVAKADTGPMQLAAHLVARGTEEIPPIIGGYSGE
jgi:hypothetical protein